MSDYMFFAILVIIVGICGYFVVNESPHQIIGDIIRMNSDIRIDANDGSDMIIHNEDVYGKLLDKGELGLAESYMDGDWSSVDMGGLLRKLLHYQDVFEDKLRAKAPILSWFHVKYKLLRLWNTNTNTKETSPQNIQKHYDVGNDLYQRMLGPTMQYTCAYFNKEGIGLDEAEENKMDLIAKKLDLKPGLRVLDIGCGFGSMAYHLATKYDVVVTGVTLSREQVDYANTHYQHENMTITFLDYRDVTGTYDRVYSVGMFEHVGSRNYKQYFNKCHDLLEEDGVMLLHTMGISKPNENQDKYFASTYIFPEGELPDINRITSSFSDDWRLEDFQNMGISYSKTFDAWRTNLGDWSGLDAYDTRFRRMWDYYLHLFAENFRCQNFLLWQFVFTKKAHSRADDCHFIRSP